jgi:hypothetical protein
VLVKARPVRPRWIQILAITGIALVAAFLLRFSFKATH